MDQVHPVLHESQPPKVEIHPIIHPDSHLAPTLAPKTSYKEAPATRPMEETYKKQSTGKAPKIHNQARRVALSHRAVSAPRSAAPL